VTILLKLFLAPALVILSTLVGRRWGPAAAGVLIALPVVAGPILLVTELEQGRRFTAQAASASLLGLVALAVFAVVFARMSLTRGWVPSLAVAWFCCLLTDLGLVALPVVPPVLGLALSLAATGVAARVISSPPASPTEALATRPGWDLPARAVATASLVLALTGAAAGLGPGLTGVLAPFPIATSVVAAFTLAQHGPAATIALLRGVLRGLVGFATFCFLVAVLLRPAGPVIAFTLALAAALVVQYLARAANPAPGAAQSGAARLAIR
jgi:hypothetical protein